MLPIDQINVAIADSQINCIEFVEGNLWCTSVNTVNVLNEKYVELRYIVRDLIKFFNY